MVRSASLASLALLLSVPAAPARAAEGELPKEPGVYWEQSVEMQMAGFSMPAQTSKVCLPKKGMEEPPRNAKDDGKCKTTDVKRTGSRMTWKMKCEDGSTGEGDVTSGPDAFDGKMTMRTQGQEVHMKMKGKKVGGDCDANELRRQVASVQRNAEKAQADQAKAQLEMCDDAAQKMALEMFVSPYPGVPVSCKDPAKLCARLDTREGLVALRQSAGKESRAKVEKLCKKDLDASVEKLCTAAKKEQDKGTRYSDQASMEFVFAYCPDLAKALAKRECAGRKFTALPDAQREFCTRWAQQRLEGGGEAEVAQPAKAAAGKYLKSGIPDASASDDQPAAKKDKKKKPAASEDEEAQPQKPKDGEDVKSRILKGIFGR